MKLLLKVLAIDIIEKKNNSKVFIQFYSWDITVYILEYKFVVPSGVEWLYTSTKVVSKLVQLCLVCYKPIYSQR